MHEFVQATLQLQASFFASDLIKHASFMAFLVFSSCFCLWLSGFLPVLSEPTTIAGQLRFLATSPEMPGRLLPGKGC